MDNLNDLKALWLTADTRDLPAAEEMVRFVKKYRNKKLWKKAALIITALVLAGIQIAAMFFQKPAMFTTELGQALLALACIILAATNINSFNRMYGLKDVSNKEFVAFFEKTRQRQIFFHTKTQVLCFALCSVGLMLYPYQMVYKSAFWAVVVYGASTLYLAIMWFVIRPRKYKKLTLKMNQTMERLKALEKQF